ncbi:MAG TPA: polysaccharide deacetylase family protein [Kofleriaceae bacterium]
MGQLGRVAARGFLVVRGLRALGVLAAVGAVLGGCHDEHWLTYPWDDRRVLCSQTIDDLTLTTPWDLVEDQMLDAEQTDSVLILHAHEPRTTISIAAIERVLGLAERRHLEFLTFRDLDPAARPRAGLALAFDDNAIDAWFSVRGLLATHGARVTFFVTRWQSRDDGERAELRMLAGDGHDIEPHSANHLHAKRYVQDHGLEAYMADEVMPSIDGLVQAGYPAPTTYAYPFGENSAELDAAILGVVPRVRVSTGTCPY